MTRNSPARNRAADIRIPAPLRDTVSSGDTFLASEAVRSRLPRPRTQQPETHLVAGLQSALIGSLPLEHRSEQRNVQVLHAVHDVAPYAPCRVRCPSPFRERDGLAERRSEHRSGGRRTSRQGSRRRKAPMKRDVPASCVSCHQPKELHIRLCPACPSKASTHHQPLDEPSTRNA